MNYYLITLFMKISSLSLSQCVSMDLKSPNQFNLYLLVCGVDVFRFLVSIFMTFDTIFWISWGLSNIP